MPPLLLLLPVAYLLCCHSVVGEEGQAIDFFYDEDDASNWVILSGIINDEWSSKWDEDEVWDTIDENLETQKGHYASRKCQNLFGKIMCLCQFKRLMGEPHRCRQSVPKDLKRQRMTRSHSTLSHPIGKAIAAARVPVNRAQLPQLQQSYNELNSIGQEQAVEDDIASAQMDIDNMDDEAVDINDLEELQQNIDELIQEEEELIEGEAEDELFEDALDDLGDEDTLLSDEDNTAGYDLLDEALGADEVLDDVVDDDAQSANAQLSYDADMIGALDDTVKTQNDIIGRQSHLIEQLKEDNAMKEALIAVIDESDEEESDEMDNEKEEYEDASDFVVANEEYDAVNEEYYENADAMEKEDEEEEYFDDMDEDEALAQEEYNELYDVDGEEKEEQYDDEYIDENRENDEDEARDLREEEAKAMIADTFWGLEIYTVAFMVLCGCCIVCYCHKTKCCGYFKSKQEATESFGYAKYAQQGGFNRVFGNQEDEEDVEMGKVRPNDSDEAEMLQS